jgi:hypothetical protein
MVLLSPGMLRRVVWLKFTDVSEVLAASIIRAMTHRNNPEQSHLHARCRENLKPHKVKISYNMKNSLHCCD